MPKKQILCILILCCLPFVFLKAQGVETDWNTFLGGVSTDNGYDITLDSSGNIYIIGSSSVSWGSPVNAHSGNSDAFAARLDSSGNLVWNTFLGSSGSDDGHGIILDDSGNIYVYGISYATWGSPVNSYSGNDDVFIACLDSSGNLQWNTFLGSSNTDFGYNIVINASDQLLVAGSSGATWGSPVNAFGGGMEAFAACLNTSGNLVWNTFIGSSSADYGYGIALDNTGNIFVTGRSNATWGTPVNAYSGGNDIFIAGLGNTGTLQWNTFLGSSGSDIGNDINTDNSGNIYLTGYSDATWGTPVNAYSGSADILVAGLNGSGSLLWNTFLGSTDPDSGHCIEVSASGIVYVGGSSDATWGSPINDHSGGNDIVAAALDSSGDLLWHTFLGCDGSDYCRGIAAVGSGIIYLTGQSYWTWGTPLNSHSGVYDAFVARLSIDPAPDITANGSDGPVSITESDTLRIRVTLNAYGLTDNVDFWLAYKGPSGWVHYNNSTKKWEAGLGVTHQGPLMDLNNKKVFQSSGLAPGVYTFYFGVDMNMDGKVTKSSLYKDEVQVTVTSN